MMSWNLLTPVNPVDTIHSTLLNPSPTDTLKNDQCTQINKVFHQLKLFREVGRFCDIVIHVYKAKFLAHRAVLAAWSPKLAAEISGKSEDLAELTIQCNSEETFTRCLDFMYSGNIPLTSHNVLPILQLAQALNIDPLVHICERFYIQSVDNNTFVEHYFLSLKHKLPNLQEKVLEFVKDNITAIIERAELLTLSPQDFKVFITQGRLAGLKQEMKFSLILSWAGMNVQDRDKYLLHLFNHVYWTASVEELLVQISVTQNIFTTNEFCLFQLLHSLVMCSGHQLGPFSSSYPRLYSIYSHMLDDLVQPKVFTLPSHILLDSNRSWVSVKCAKNLSKIKPKTADIGVNTVVCFESFDDVSEDTLEVEEGLEPDYVNTDNNVDNSTPDVTFEKLEKSNTEVLNGNPKHRRKSLPRKIQQDSAKSTKKPVKRQRKSVAKDTKESVKSEGAKKGKNGKSDPVAQELEGSEANDIEGKDYVGNEVLDPTAESEAVEDLDQTLDDLLDEYGGDTDTEDINHVLDVDNIVEKDKANDKDNVKSARVKTKGTDDILKSKRRGRPQGSKNRKHEKLKKVEKAKKVRMKVEFPKSMRRMYSCTYQQCKFSSRSSECLAKHVERVHLVGVILSCYKCDYTTNEMKVLCNHMKTHYPTLPYRCEVDDCKLTFMRVGLFVRHQMNHLNIKPYMCELCGKTFTLYNQLSCHKKLHLGRQFACDVCGKRFTTKGAMQAHMATHDKKKPYLCDTCGFSTKHQSHLISHRKLHTGDVLRCSIPDCTYTTPKQGHMTAHMNSHLNIRNHICQVCGKAFTVRSKLIRHEKIHLKEKLYKCKQCDYQTSRTDRMKLHIESHGIKFPKKKYNQPNFEVEQETGEEVDYHHFYERIQSDASTNDNTQGSNNSLSNLATITHSTGIPYLSLSEMKPMDVISFAASTSMIVDNFNPTSRLPLDPLSHAAAVANIDELQTATNFAQNFDRIQATAFDQL